MVMARTERFSPGVIDYDGQMSAGYARGRALSPAACSVWCATLAPFVQTLQPARILDLGSGTGRFAGLFARSFDNKVIGVEPSQRMLAAALCDETPANLTYVAGSAESIPLKNGSCGLAWLSHVWHHVRGRHMCARELRRVLGRGKTVLVRGTFGDKPCPRLSWKSLSSYSLRACDLHSRRTAPGRIVNRRADEASAV